MSKPKYPHKQPFNVSPKKGAKKNSWWNPESSTYWRKPK